MRSARLADLLDRPFDARVVPRLPGDIGLRDDADEGAALVDDRDAADLLALGAGQQTSSAAGKGGYTPSSWAAALLGRLGIAQTKYNVHAVQRWEAQEGGNWHNRAAYNPLNTTQKMPGATSMNSAGVKAYQSWDQGLDATVSTLHNGRYGGILKALSGGQEKDIFSAIVRSPWGTKNLPHYSKGSWRIGQDEVAKIHQGEMILPASIAEAVRTSMRHGMAGQQGGGGGKSVVIQVILNGASESDARQLAKRVKEILDEDNAYSTIGGF